MPALSPALPRHRKHRKYPGHCPIFLTDRTRCGRFEWMTSQLATKRVTMGTRMVLPLVTRQGVREKVLGHASRTGLSDSRFGVMATGDPSLVRRLRRGEAPRLGTVDRVLAFLGEPPMASGFLLEVEAIVEVTRTKESVFSRESSGNQSFLTQLRRGMLPRLDTADRVRTWMECQANWQKVEGESPSCRRFNQPRLSASRACVLVRGHAKRR